MSMSAVARARESSPARAGHGACAPTPMNANAGRHRSASRPRQRCFDPLSKLRVRDRHAPCPPSAALGWRAGLGHAAHLFFVHRPLPSLSRAPGPQRLVPRACPLRQSSRRPERVFLHAARLRPPAEESCACRPRRVGRCDKPRLGRRSRGLFRAGGGRWRTASGWRRTIFGLEAADPRAGGGRSPKISGWRRTILGPEAANPAPFINRINKEHINARAGAAACRRRRPCPRQKRLVGTTHNQNRGASAATTGGWAHSRHRGGHAAETRAASRPGAGNKPAAAWAAKLQAPARRLPKSAGP